MNDIFLGRKRSPRTRGSERKELEPETNCQTSDAQSLHLEKKQPPKSPFVKRELKRVVPFENGRGIHRNRYQVSSIKPEEVQNIHNPIRRNSDEAYAGQRTTAGKEVIKEQFMTEAKAKPGLSDTNEAMAEIDGKPSTFAFQVASALVKELELKAQEAKQTAEAAREELDIVKIAEAKANARLEFALASEKEARRTTQRRQQRVQELLSQSEKAKQAAEEAREKLDTIGIVEAEAMAELDIALAAREKINSDIETIKSCVQQLQMEAKELREEAGNKLNAVKKEEAEAKATAQKAIDELYSVRERKAFSMAELKAVSAEEERAKQTTEEVRKHINDLETELEVAKAAAAEAMEKLHDTRVIEARLSAGIAASRAEEEDAMALTEGLSARIQELQAKRTLSLQPSRAFGPEAANMTEVERTEKDAVAEFVSYNALELGTKQVEIERSDLEAMKDENPLYSSKSMGDSDVDQRTQPSEAAIAAG